MLLLSSFVPKAQAPGRPKLGSQMLDLAFLSGSTSTPSGALSKSVSTSIPRFLTDNRTKCYLLPRVVLICEMVQWARVFASNMTA